MDEEKQYSERLAQGPAEAIQSYYTAPLLRGARKVFEIYLTLLKAHAVMLAEEKIVAQDHAAAILRELVAIEEAGFEYDDEITEYKKIFKDFADR